MASPLRSRRRSIASAIPVTSPASTNAASVWETTSGIPPTAVVMMGTSDAAASSITIGVPSVHEVITSASKALIRRPTAGTKPGQSTLAATPNWLANRFTLSSSEKAPELAIQALAQVRNRDVRLMMVGAGPELDSVKRLANQLGVAARVDWPGFVPAVGRLMSAFDALVITSWTEGTPIVMLEAAASEVPIITTAVGGIPDVVSQTEAALVDAGDVTGIAEAIDRLLERRGEATARAQAAAQRVSSELAVGPWVEKHSRVYRKAMTLT